MLHKNLADYNTITSFLLDAINLSVTRYSENYRLRVFEKFLYGEEITDEEEFYCVIYFNELCQTLSRCCLTTAESVSDTLLKKNLIDLVNSNPNVIFLSSEQLFQIKGEAAASQETDENNEGRENATLTYQDEWELVSKAMKMIEHLYNSLLGVYQWSSYKIFYEYLGALNINTGRAIDNQKFLLSELEKISKIKQVIEIEYDKNLNDTVNLKKQLAALEIIPPGIIKGLAVGTPLYILGTLLHRAERVANYFLQFTNEPALDTSQNQ